MNPRFIDSHAHLDGPEFDADRDACLARARAAGVQEIVLIGATGDVSTAERAIALAETDPHLYATVGVHPHDVADMQPSWWPRLAELVVHPKVVGVGETGLDYFYDNSPKELQREIFGQFIDFARKHRKAIVCHVRDAHEDAREVLRQHWRGGEAVADAVDTVDTVDTAHTTERPGCVIHCFTGTAEDAAAYVEMGCYISFSGIATFKGKRSDPIRAAIHAVPTDRILIETDCPYLAPQPVRGKRNEPAYVVHTAETVARELGLPVAELAALTVANTRTFFSLTAA